MTPENLRKLIEDDEFGLLELRKPTVPLTGEDRLIRGFEEVVEFVVEKGRPPEINSMDMSERKLASRLRAINGSEEQRALLEDHDELGILKAPKFPSSLEEVLADDSLGLLNDDVDLFRLRHVPKTHTVPERMARRKPSLDFDKFEDLFKSCHEDLRAGRRKLLPFRNPQQITDGSFFILNGVLTYVAHIGERRQDATGDSNARTRCIFENATESDLLLRSLASQLYQDGRRVTEPELVFPERMKLEPGTPMGVVYVLRSLSDDPRIRAIPNLHKIGCTVLTTEQRTRDAVKEPTYMMKPVEIMAEYEVPAGVESRVEHLLHRLFAAARLDVVFQREGRILAEAHEWFSVPLDVIDEAIQLIESEAIVNYEFDPDHQRLRLRH